MNSRTPFLAIATTALLCSCATNTGVLPMGPNLYTISVEREVMLGGGSAAKQVAYTDAANYCQTKGQQSEVTGVRLFHSSLAPDTGIELQFRCVAQ